MAARDRPTSAASHPPPVELLLRVWPPMLATLAAAEDVPATHRLEVKYDGFRALAGLSGGRVCLQSRNGKDLSVRFPGVARALAQVAVGEAALDGEIFSAAGFQGLEDGSGVRYVAFDLVWLEGEDLRSRPIEERRALLERLLAEAPPGVGLAEEVPGPIAKALARARREGWEGVVAKAPGSGYEGRRSRAWLKVKVSASQELAVVGFTPLAGGERGVGALLLGVGEGGRLVYAGKVGTGFSQALRRQLLERLLPDVVPQPAVAGAPRLREARWVAPRLVAEVAFADWTHDGRLRHPSFKGLRPDKAPEEVVRERPGRPDR